MKLEIYNDTTPETEKVLRLQLRKESGSIRLIAVDERGVMVRAGNILRFNPDGSITRCRGVDPAFGLDLDAQGRVEIN